MHRISIEFDRRAEASRPNITQAAILECQHQSRPSWRRPVALRERPRVHSKGLSACKPVATDRFLDPDRPLTKENCGGPLRVKATHGGGDRSGENRRTASAP